jgi:photosystem II stability/assembly factor-like uncharacterized protein
MRGLITIGAPAYSGLKPYVHVTQDGGYTWQQQNLPLPPAIYTQELQPPLPDVSSDWQWGLLGPPQVFTLKDGIMRVNFQNNNQGIGQFIRPMAAFYVTHDSGTTWKHTTPLPLKPMSSYADIGLQPSDFADINNGWLADHDTLYTTTTRGHEWAKISSAGFQGATQLNFVSPQVGWALRKAECATKPNSSPLAQTTDGGNTWNPVAYTISRR